MKETLAASERTADVRRHGWIRSWWRGYVFIFDKPARSFYDPHVGPRVLCICAVLELLFRPLLQGAVTWTHLEPRELRGLAIVAGMTCLAVGLTRVVRVPLLQVGLSGCSRWSNSERWFFPQVVACLSGRGRQTTPAPPSCAHFNAEEIPPVAELLDVDREYREKAAAGKLPMITPRQFNPTGEAWLPILRAERQRRNYTALYSNTARAHELGTTHDWVVIYLDDESNRYQCTVITSRFGSLRGHRIIRGREDECREHYDQIKEQKCLPL